MTDFSSEYEHTQMVESSIGNYLTPGELVYGEKMIGLPSRAEREMVPFGELSLAEQIMTVDRVGSLLDKAGVTYSACGVSATSMTRAEIGVYTSDDPVFTIPNRRMVQDRAAIHLYKTFQRTQGGTFLGGVEGVGATVNDFSGIHLERKGEDVYMIGESTQGGIDGFFRKHKGLLKDVTYDARDGLKGTTLNGYAVRISVKH